MTSTNCSVLHLWSVTAHDWTMCLQRSADFEQENGYPSSDRPVSCSAVWNVIYAQTIQPQGHTTISSEALSGPTRSTLNNETYFLLLFETPPHLHSDRANRALPDQPTFRTAEWRNKPDDIDMQMEKERKTWEFKGGRRTSFNSSTQHRKWLDRPSSEDEKSEANWQLLWDLGESFTYSTIGWTL